MGGGPCGPSPQTTCIQTRTQTLRPVAFWAVTGEIPENPGDPASRLSILSASWEFLDLVPADFLQGESQGLVCEAHGNLDPWLLLAPGWGVGEPLPAAGLAYMEDGGSGT